MVKNSLEIALSLTVFEILTLFHFPLKSKMAAESGSISYGFRDIDSFFIFRKNPRWPPKVAKIEIFPHLTGEPRTILWVKNLLEITLSLTIFEIFVISHIFTKSSNKVAITHLYIEQQL